MAPPSKYTPTQKAGALDRLRAGEYLSHVAADTGIPKQTLSRWAGLADIDVAQPERTAAATGAAQRKWAERRAELVDRCGDVAALLLERIADEQADDPRGNATAFGILVDKAQLLSGQPTHRHEYRDAERRQERVAKMTDELEQRRQTKTG